MLSSQCRGGYGQVFRSQLLTLFNKISFEERLKRIEEFSLVKMKI